MGVIAFFLVVFMAANCVSQGYLWVMLWQAVEYHHWSDGLWGTFAVGALFVIVALWLQLQTRARAIKARVEQARKTGIQPRIPWYERWVPRLILWSLLVGAFGNVFDLFWMKHRGVPWGEQDSWLTAIAASSFVFIMILPFLRSFFSPRTEVASSRKPRKRSVWYKFLLTNEYPSVRFKLAGGLSSRVTPQFALGLMIIFGINSPMNRPLLIALTIVMFTFTCVFYFQKKLWKIKAYPTDEATANLGMYGMNFAILIALFWVVPTVLTTV